MGKWIERLIVAFGLVVVSVVATPAAAQNIFTGEPIANIRVEGNQRIEAETLSYMQLTRATFRGGASTGGRNLFASGLFAMSVCVARAMTWS